MHRTDLALNECALYKVRSPWHLAEVLMIDYAALGFIARRGKLNYREYPKEMSAGKPARWIECPGKALMRVQRRVRRLLAQILPPEFLHSGVKERSSATNAAQHCTDAKCSVPLIKLDIAKFFPSSDGRRVYWFFRQTMQCSSEVSRFLCSLTTIPATKASNHLHLPTGGATSQALAYCCYKEMFDALYQLATDNGVTLGVFVDDIAFSGPKATSRLLNEARVIINRFGLESKRSKEDVWDANDAKLVTGVVLTRGGMRLPNARRLNIHQLHQSLRRAQNIEEKALIARRLLGALFSAGQIEERYLRQGHGLLRRLKRDASSWDAIQHASKQDGKLTHTDTHMLAESIYNTGSRQ